MHSDYEKRFKRVLTHVYENLDGDLSLDALAEIAAFSRFHFHRVFTATTGETVAHFIRRVRVMRASHELLASDRQVDEVARICGYPNPRSFSRAFRAHFGQTPTAYRANGKPLPALRLNETGDFKMYDVELTDLEARCVLGVAHTGAYFTVGKAFEAAGMGVMGQGIEIDTSRMIGVYYDDPSVVPEAELQAFAGFIAAEGQEVGAAAPPLEARVLGAGKHAVLRFKGPYAGLADAYAYLFGAWIPKSGEIPKDAPLFEIYENGPHNTAPADLVTCIYVPLI